MDFRKTKEYIPSKKENANVMVSDPNHEYMFYDIKNDLNKITTFKSVLINTFIESDSLEFYKLICNDNNWYYKEGLYVKENNELFPEFDTLNFKNINQCPILWAFILSSFLHFSVVICSDV